MNLFRTTMTFLLLLHCLLLAAAEPRTFLIVSQKGDADFKTIQGAIASLSDTATETRTVWIKNGTYKEKLYIEKHNLLIRGESREGVLIAWPSAREEWRCTHTDDWGVATVNVDGNDVTLQDLSVRNTFGFDWQADKTIGCGTDSSGKKVISRTGHQMAVRTMKATRFKALNCHVQSYAGDAMSPWNVAAGMFYFKDCTIEGGVDLYCPRGWAYAENCTFVALRGDAVLWHDGSASKDAKTVLKSCFFDGYKGFQLGRYHKDAQFYMVSCRFSAHMADKAICHVETKNTVQWGHRAYYHHCHKADGDLPWFADNFPDTIPDPDSLAPSWVFGARWNPLKQ